MYLIYNYICFSSLSRDLKANGSQFHFDYHNGQWGFNTDPARGADTFVPFSGKWHKVASLNPNGVTVGAVTFDFKELTSQYKMLELYRSIMPVATSISGGATDISYIACNLSYNYEKNTGIFTATARHSNAGWSISAQIDLYATV